LATTSDHDFSYLSFAYDATDLELEGSYDYVIVGGGTSGCPLAATLSEKYKVLVLERGTLPTAYPNLLTSDGFIYNLQQEDDGQTPVERFVSGDGIDDVRGRVLGGTSMINAGVYARANTKIFSASGIEWDMDLVNQTYDWVEDTIVYKPDKQAWQSLTKTAFLEAGVLPDNGFSLDHEAGTRLTGSTFDNNGTRHASDELLNKGDPNNLRVAVHASVEKIIFSSNSSGVTAIGVIYKDSNGTPHQAFVRGEGEVIVSAGPIGSPQLLLLSGVGPESYLSSLNIPVVLSHPYVGQFLHDNPRNFINILPPNPIEPSTVTVLGITSNFYQCSFSSLPFSIPPFAFFPNPTYPLPNSTFAHFVNKVPGPLSYGSITLNSDSDVRVAPNVKFNYYSNSTDLAHCVSGMKKIGELLSSDALKPYKVEDLPGIDGFDILGIPLPENQTDDAAFETFCREAVASYWHYHGGCLVGEVLDGDFRVTGINALRVVDGSTFPYSPASHPQGFYLMLGRYVGSKILQERSAA
uniref:Hydroxynitrile lyase n=1 Tax=Prunus mume TaxID=102107 RepID=UPI0002662AE1|nr:Chain A, Hydroxynitrile lyase [Prunus mume]3RED_B Chain B, Hydroxynitrile lyase [Prunus mume]3RED_C Chain C, Hydroxynitrile lyase [Prunus mume]3RED_D Chain D, Hydroxynitrile lyase [Prunus mume]3RED_E Chain E, Hydroxynitrile lyase [Prunus mume]3RED_F Chain F, Hydroxynitrile lyase [Prunus mume]3RED_G Chain G, Hydroxynitrile lyase [Prunus mume]3RED_H Chain H, Hydroxynitrile lyase [Prunus mume]3RED_I Chain I, Hydroxynitrile lyase [Prunus mume]3RED_J Chain J, Hydroxynitrile lyase [Prunus mum